MSDYLTNWSLSAGNEHEVRDGRNVKIVNVECGGMTGRKYDEATKIAALIRAAPALLLELEMTVDLLERASRTLTEECKSALEGRQWGGVRIASARAAIALAKGESA